MHDQNTNYNFGFNQQPNQQINQSNQNTAQNSIQKINNFLQNNFYQKNADLRDIQYRRTCFRDWDTKTAYINHIAAMSSLKNYTPKEIETMYICKLFLKSQDKENTGEYNRPWNTNIPYGTAAHNPHSNGLNKPSSSFNNSNNHQTNTGNSLFGNVSRVSGGSSIFGGSTSPTPYSSGVPSAFGSADNTNRGDGNPRAPVFGSNAGASSNFNAPVQSTTPSMFSGSGNSPGIFGQGGITNNFGQGGLSSTFNNSSGPTSSIFGVNTKPATVFGGGNTGTTSSVFGSNTGTTSSVFGSNTGITSSVFGSTTTSPVVFGSTATNPSSSVFGGNTSPVSSIFRGISNSHPSTFSGSGNIGPPSSIFQSNTGTPSNSSSVFGNSSTTPSSIFGGNTNLQTPAFGRNTGSVYNNTSNLPNPLSASLPSSSFNSQPENIFSSVNSPGIAQPQSNSDYNTQWNINSQQPLQQQQNEPNRMEPQFGKRHNHMSSPQSSNAWPQSSFTHTITSPTQQSTFTHMSSPNTNIAEQENVVTPIQNPAETTQNRMLYESTDIPATTEIEEIGKEEMEKYEHLIIKRPRVDEYYFNDPKFYEFCHTTEIGKKMMEPGYLMFPMQTEHKKFKFELEIWPETKALLESEDFTKPLKKMKYENNKIIKGEITFTEQFLSEEQKERLLKESKESNKTEEEETTNGIETDLSEKEKPNISNGNDTLSLTEKGVRNDTEPEIQLFPNPSLFTGESLIYNAKVVFNNSLVIKYYEPIHSKDFTLENVKDKIKLDSIDPSLIKNMTTIKHIKLPIFKDPKSKGLNKPCYCKVYDVNPQNISNREQLSTQKDLSSFIRVKTNLKKVLKKNFVKYEWTEIGGCLEMTID